MFFLNRGYKWMYGEQVQGVALLASANGYEKLIRRTHPDCQRLLFDPQLYLSSLDADNRTKTCARLASHPWFGIEGPEFDSGQRKLKEWENEMREVVPDIWSGQPPSSIDEASVSAIEFQLSLSCSDVIIPTPLIVEREDEATALAAWLDAGIDAAADLEIGEPLLATVALQDIVLNEAVFDEAGFLDAVVDQVTSREEIDGVYLLVAHTTQSHPFKLGENVARAYLHLASAFAAAGKDCITNFADTFGLVCMAEGATGFASGQSQSLRRLSLDGFRDRGGGVAVPQFYSHRCAAEFSSETDLSKIQEVGLLRRVADETPFSQALMRRLRAGGAAGELPAWAESRNNLTAAQKHFLHRLVVEEKALAGVSVEDRFDRVMNWLEDAAANALYIQTRLESSVGKAGLFAPSEEWRELLGQ